MTYDQLVNAVENALAPLAAAAGGRVIVAESLEEARKFLDAAPNRWRVILHWEGYAEHPEARNGMTSHQVATAIQAPRGLAHKPDVTKDKPSGAPAFSSYIAVVIGWMTALRFPNGTGADIAGFSLTGSQWLETQPGYAAHVLTWRLDAALPAFTTTIPLEFPHLNP